MQFYKLSGSGNDFVFLDGRTTHVDEWPAERVRLICARRSGVGADGLVLLETAESGTDRPRVRFHYFNADGNRSDMCGNASLCAARVATYLGLVPPGPLILQTDVGEVQAEALDGPGERARIGLPDVPAPTHPDIPLVSGESWMCAYQAGVPHLVIRVENLEARSADPDVRGRALRRDPQLGPAGANVNFIEPQEDGAWRYRTFERGVEGETLACGTGAVAVAAAVLHLEARQASSSASSDQESDRRSVDLYTRSGKLLRVRGKPQSDGAFLSPELEGEGRLVFEAELKMPL